MNKIKLVVLCSSIILISGCTATYNIDITENVISESLSIIETNQNTLNSSVDSSSDYTVREAIQSAIDGYQKVYYDDYSNDDDEKLKGVEYYNISSTGGSGLGVKYSYEYNNINNYQRSYIVHNCYDLFKVYEEARTLKITSSNEMKCFNKYIHLDNVQVIVNTENEVVNHNADQVNNHSYIWNITKNNATNKPIIFEVRLSTPTPDSESESDSNPTHQDEQTTLENNVSSSNTITNIIIAVASIFVVIIIIVIILINKNKRNNRI